MKFFPKIFFMLIMSVFFLAGQPVQAQANPAGEATASVSLPEGELKNIKFDLAAFGQIGSSNPVDIGWDQQRDRYTAKQYGGEARVALPISKRVTIGARGSFSRSEINRRHTGTTQIFSGATVNYYDTREFEQTRWEGAVIAQYHRPDRSRVVSASVGVSSETSSYYDSSSNFTAAPCCYRSEAQRSVDLAVGLGYEHQISPRARVGAAANAFFPLAFRNGYATPRSAPYPYNTTFSTKEREYALGAFGEYRLSRNIRLRADADARLYRNQAVSGSLGLQAIFWNTLSIGPQAAFRIRGPGYGASNYVDTTVSSIQQEVATSLGVRSQIRIRF